MWWVFVVATMLAGGIDWFTDDDESTFGWTAYTPLTDMPRRYADYMPQNDVAPVDTISLLAFCLLVLTALVEAVAVRRPVAGMITVAVPFAAAGLIWCALPRGHSGFVLGPLAALVVILVAVGIREIWEHRLSHAMDRIAGSRQQSPP